MPGKDSNGGLFGPKKPETDLLIFWIISKRVKDTARQQFRTKTKEIYKGPDP
jgi:hypothetical protein